MMLNHGDEKRCQLYCPVDKCGKMYSSAESYRKHVMREHRVEFGKIAESSSYGSSNEPDVQFAPCNEQACQDAYSKDELSVANMINNITRVVCMFALNMREQNLLAKSTCTSIMTDVSSLLSTYHENFSDLVSKCLDEHGIRVAQSHPISVLLTDDSCLTAV